MIIYIENIDPGRAQELLRRNGRNRRLDKGTVDRYAEAMRRGEWQLSHQGIAVGENGELLDGQHRLEAIIKADIAVEMPVARGMSRDAFSVLDTGKRRSPSDALRLAGATDTLHLSAALRYLHIYLNSPDSMWSGSATRLTNDQILDLRDKHPRMEECVRKARPINANTGIITSACATALYVTLDACPDMDIDPWVTGITTGANLDIGDSRLALRNFFANVRAVSGKRRVDAREHIAIYIKAWNAWRTGRKIKVLFFRKGEVMPRPVDTSPLFE
ncbi:hypothetical protein ACFQ08_00890 [Streptosporangium algeriense]|uniref:ParB/Sulfiredoxin domain-containing protein n=1 Tax=Streptosporangium algeriense TaxID=1682748 RepID=A0ABW3DHF0_9ACTN